MNPYEIMGVGEEFTPVELKQRYRQLAKQFHPDRNEDPAANDQMAEITVAYGVLKDPDKRAVYDETGQFQVRSVEAHAVNRIVTIFCDLGKKQKWGKSGYIQSMRKGFNDSLVQLRKARSEMEDIRARMDMMIPLSDEEENIFANAIRQQQGNLDRDLKKLDQDVEINRCALDMLKPYDDNLPPEEFVRGFTIITTGTNSSTTTGAY